MQEIRWHGRGGDGAFTAAKLLGYAASMNEGKYAQAFPSFGPERRGAPVQGFTRISNEVICDHSQVYACDLIIVLDDTLCEVVDVKHGIKEDGILVINTQKDEKSARADFGLEDVKNLVVLDGTAIALEVLGRPIVNTVMLGAALATCDVVSLEATLKAVEGMMAKNLQENNKKAISTAYEKVKGQK